jgi:5-methylcytosine-specific restriction endonuclease McrA
MAEYSERKKLYKTKEWQRLRYHQLRANPVCKYCEAQGRVELATIVDHIKPHKGDEELFFDPDNLQSLCKTHHDSTKQREEHHGSAIGGDKKGYPLDQGHHWYE